MPMGSVFLVMNRSEIASSALVMIHVLLAWPQVKTYTYLTSILLSRLMINSYVEKPVLLCMTMTIQLVVIV